MTSPGHTEDSLPLRERTRRAVQTELLAIAQTLFARDGYDAVTIDQIAAAAGISRRSFFRYFPSKDAVVLSKYDRQGEAFAEALAARPQAEPPWLALRRMFDDVVDYVADPERAARAEELSRIINSSETLRAGYLERMQRAQHGVVQQLQLRSSTLEPVAAAALVSAAFAALSTAHEHARTTGSPLDRTLDQAMTAIAQGALGSL